MDRLPGDVDEVELLGQLAPHGRLSDLRAHARATEMSVGVGSTSCVLPVRFIG